jgi:hypothetical protein
MKLNEGLREALDDPAVDEGLRKVSQNLKFKADNAYYLIRETVSFTSIEYHLKTNSALNASFDADASAFTKGATGASVGGEVFRQGGTAQDLVQTFAEPHRLLYNEERLQPSGIGIAGRGIRHLPVFGSKLNFTRE